MADGGTGQGTTDGFHLIVDALRTNRVATMYGVVGIPITDVARIAQAAGIRYTVIRGRTRGSSGKHLTRIVFRGLNRR